MRYRQNIPVCHFNFGKSGPALDLIQKSRDQTRAIHTVSFDAKFMNQKSTREIFACRD